MDCITHFYGVEGLHGFIDLGGDHIPFREFKGQGAFFLVNANNRCAVFVLSPNPELFKAESGRLE